MTVIKVHDLIRKRVLVTRESAQGIGPELAAAMAEGRGKLELDFTGIDGVTPSFLDEILAIIERHLSARKESDFRVIIVNPPTRLSLKFSAVGRGHGVSVTESVTGAWIITRER